MIRFLRMVGRHRFAFMVLAVAGGMLAVRPAVAAAFTPAQRAAIVEIMREALRTDPSILRDAITTLQNDETRRQQSATGAEIARLHQQLTGDLADPAVGNPHGDVTVVEFYDVRCPYCRRMVPVMAQLLKADPKVRLVYKDIPILGPPSVLAARALLAAQKQGGYARLHEILMTGTPNITPEVVKQAATQAGLDWARLSHDMDSPAVAARIKANIALAHQLGITGTPGYVIGDQLLPGAMELADLQAAVAAARRH